MTFDIEAFLIREAAKLEYQPEPAQPLDWASIPGDTMEAKKASLLAQAANILRGSPNILADAYGAVQNVPFQGGYGSPNYMIPAHELYRALLAHQGQLSGKQKKEFNALFGEEPQSLISDALKEHGHEFDPDVAYLFGQRQKDRSKVEKVKGMPPDKFQAIMISYRQHLIQTIQQEVLALFDNLASQYNITKAEFCHLLRVRNNLGQLRYVGYGAPGSFVEKVGGEAQAAELARQARAALTSRKSELHKLMLAPLFSGINASEEEKALNPKAAPISDEEILAPIGLLPTHYPNLPQQEFNLEPIPNERIPKSQLTPEQFAQKQETWKRNRINNIDLLRKYLIAGGFENGDGLASLISTANRMAYLKEELPETDEEVESTAEDGAENLISDRRYAARVVYYYYSRLCNNNPSIFADMLDRAGFGYLKDYIRAKVYPDQLFSPYKLDFRSQAEADVVERLRRVFNLMATPIPISMPSPPECPTNPEAFVIDFTIPCDVLDRWEPDEMKVMHPKIKSKMIFVGEYFGFDSRKEITIPQGQIWTKPDGSVATYVDSEGVTSQMVGGAKIEYGMRYKLASEWKRMGETFVAHATGNAVIHIAKDSKDTEISAELDRNHIIYQSAIQGLAEQQLAWHADACQKQDCEVHKYITNIGGQPKLNVKKHSIAEAYIRSCMADVNIRYAYMPSIAMLNRDFGREAMYRYYQRQQELDHQRSVAWQAFEKAAREKRADVPILMNEYIEICHVADREKTEFMKELSDRMQDQVNSPEYQYRQKGLENLLSQVLSGSPYTDEQVSLECGRLLSPYVQIPEQKKPWVV